ncbi:MAG TPA: hypothetical protein VMA77_09425 [Solirubrobacteraceae bacterium]|nr:hypothetical protein [Solirubrobacteraceae bacterium]
MTELQRPAPLDARCHKRDHFDNGELVLGRRLRRYAGRSRRRDTAATWVIADADDVVVAYASSAMTGIERSAAPGHARQRPHPIRSRH